MIRRYFAIVFLLNLILGCDDSESNSDDSIPRIEFNNELALIKTYGGSEEDDALSVVETSDGNIAVLGFTQSPDGDVEGKTTTDSDYWLMKLDRDLNIIWQKTFGGTSDDRGQDIVATSDGGYLLTGFSRSSDGDVSENFGFHDYWVIKLSSSGDLLWEKSFGFSGNDRSFSAIQTMDGGYFITGFLDVSASGGEGNDNGTAGRQKPTLNKHGVGEFWGIKLNAEGVVQWRRYFGGSNNDRAYDAIQSNDGNIIMAGTSESDDFDVENPRGSYDFWAVKISLEGDLISEKSFGGSSIDLGYSVNKTINGNYIFAGDTRSDDLDIDNIRGNADFWVVQFDDHLNMIWEETYGGTDFESARDAIQLFSGNLLICGSTRSNDGQVSQNYGQNDAWIVTTDGNGNFINELSVGGSSLDLLQKAVELQDGSVIVVGSSESSDNLVQENKGDKDVLLIKLN